jgi:hypothetical protein
MKFNTHLTTNKSDLSGLAACRKAAEAGKIKRYLFPLTPHDAPGLVPFWRRVPIPDFEFEADSDPGVGALQVEGMTIKHREFMLEELTKHTQTAQAFIPCDGPIHVAVAAGLRGQDTPDPLATHIVPCSPGEAIIIEKGIWHTLPFAMDSSAKILTVVHRLPEGIYHDVRDLPAEGWFGEFSI